jgi:hypothetical protein
MNAKNALRITLVGFLPSRSYGSVMTTITLIKKYRSDEGKSKHQQGIHAPLQMGSDFSLFGDGGKPSMGVGNEATA